MNGSNFHPYVEDAPATCLLEDPISAQGLLALPVSYEPSLDPYSIRCDFEHSLEQLRSLNKSYIYNLRYSQSGRNHDTVYPIQILDNPRILGVSSRLVSHTENITVSGLNFDNYTANRYECLYKERGSQTEVDLMDVQMSAPATITSSTSLTCPPLKDTPTYLERSNERGFTCLTIYLKDALAGHIFSVEPGTITEWLASPCFIGDISSFVPNTAAVYPPLIPLKPSDISMQISDAARSLNLYLSTNLDLLSVFGELGSPPSAIKLRFSTIIVDSQSGDLILTDSAAISNAIHVEIDCSYSLSYLECQPWPYATPAANSTLTKSGLELVFETNYNQFGRVAYALSQSIDLF